MDLFEELAKTTTGRTLLERMQVDNGLGKYERARWWRQCKDGWRIAYTTTRAVGGKHDGKFVVMAYKPYGRGARSDPHQWELVYHRGFVKRNSARDRSIALWKQHEG